MGDKNIRTLVWKVVLQQFNLEQTKTNEQHFISREQSIIWLTIDQTKAMSPTKINVMGEYINCKKLILL